jgi:thiamine-phosphate pyrophosphorylase
LKKKSLKNSRLYVIIDKKTLKNKPVLCIAAGLRGSAVSIVQFRDKGPGRKSALKEAQSLADFFGRTKTIFIINDYLDIAKLVNTDGIHLGQGDTSIGIARKILGKDKIIGISCHSITQAQRAQEQGADYISVGPVFPTSTKPEYKAVGLKLIKKVKEKIKIPFFAIGGINENNLKEVIASGAERIVVCRALLS